MKDATLPDHWRLTDVAAFAETPTSKIWRATSPDLGEVVVKILKPRGLEELQGVSWLTWCDGAGAVRVHDVVGRAILMEFVPGKSLGDIVRSGQDAKATEILAKLIKGHGFAGRPDRPNLTPLSDHLEALVKTDPAQLPPEARPGFLEARELAAKLIASTDQIRPLHGDLHHDNVLKAGRGWVAIDPKGVLGDPAFETANAFRNPEGAETVVREVGRVAAMTRQFAEVLDHGEKRMLDWAFVLCAASVAWNRDEPSRIGADVAMQAVIRGAQQSLD